MKTRAGLLMVVPVVPGFSVELAAYRVFGETAVFHTNHSCTICRCKDDSRCMAVGNYGRRIGAACAELVEVPAAAGWSFREAKTAPKQGKN